MQRYIFMVCLALLLITPVAAQDWVEVDLGVGGTFEISCQVLASSMRNDDGQELSYAPFPLWELLMIMSQRYANGDEGQTAEHRAIWDVLSEARDSCDQPVPSSAVTANTLTVRHEIWSAPDGDVALVDMVVSSNSSCYAYIDWGSDSGGFSLTDRMFWRQEFIDSCI